jgi:hypothetical protein
MARCLPPLVALAAAALPATAEAAAWTLEQGKTKAFVTSTFTYGDHGYDDDGNLIAVPEYRKFTLSGTLEHGVRPWLTAIVRGELRQEETEEEISPVLIGPVARSYGSVAGGVRVRLRQTPAWVVSTEFTVFSGGMDTSGIAAASDGPAAEVRVLAGTGRTWGGRNVFANMEAAYRATFDADEPDEVKLDLTVGAHLTPRWMLLAQSFSTIDVGGTDPGQDYKLGASIVRRVNDRLSIEIGGLTTVYGRNALQEHGGKLGFWYDF